MPRKSRPSSKTASYSLSQNQVTRLMEFVQAKADQARRNGGSRTVVDEIIVILLLHTGLKAVELVKLTIGDARDHRLRILDRQRKVQRTIHLDDLTANLLERFMEVYREGAKDKDPLLVSERGGPLGYISLYNKVRRIGQQAGLGRLSPEILRRSYIIRQFHLHGDLRKVQRLAGHAHLRTTARHLMRKIRCDVCETAVRSIDTHLIDSGHHLCPACLLEIKLPRL